MEPSRQTQTLTVHVNIDISAKALETIVALAKKQAGTEPQGGFRVDTADAVSATVSRFLAEKDFDGYVAGLDRL